MAIAITPAAEPDPPTGISLVSADTEHITFVWTAPYDGGKPITNYKLYWDSGTDGASFDPAVPESTGNAAAQITVVAGLSAGQFYQFKVTAINDIGESQMSDAATFIAADYPDAPTDVQKVAADAS